MKVHVRFFDDETLEGKAQDLYFDEPDFIVEVDDVSGIENNEMAWVPLSAVKWVELPLAENGVPETPTRKVAIRFLDGEVLRGHIDGALERHRYGIVLHLHPEAKNNGGRLRKVPIPLSPVNAHFYPRELVGRHP